MHCVIMAGGSGTRFWPMSRQKRPKQLLNILGEQSMLQITVDRLSKCKKTEKIYISTRQDLAPAIKKNIKNITQRDLIMEPSGKNTAACLGLSALHISNFDGEAVMGVFPADHLIVGHRSFEKALNHAGKVAAEHNALVTLGINPTFPSTAYGYIQYDPDKKIEKLDVYPVRTFVEKPHLNAAKRFIRSKDFLWNAGIFVWKVDVLLDELGKHMPELSAQLNKINKRIKAKRSYLDIWSEITPESIDYGLLEKAENIHVVKCDFRWNDLGSWNAVYDELPKKKDGNLVKGSGVVIDGNNNFVKNEDHFTAVVGLDNVVVISTEDATLVVNKDNVEDVRKAVNYLRKNNNEDLL